MHSAPPLSRVWTDQGVLHSNVAIWKQLLQLCFGFFHIYASAEHGRYLKLTDQGVLHINIAIWKQLLQLCFGFFHIYDKRRGRVSVGGGVYRITKKWRSYGYDHCTNLRVGFRRGRATANLKAGQVLLEWNLGKEKNEQMVVWVRPLYEPESWLSKR